MCNCDQADYNECKSGYHDPTYRNSNNNWSDYNRTNNNERESGYNAVIYRDSYERLVIDSKSEYECTTPIFRYKFDTEFIEELSIFSKVHQYDERKKFKENWELWIKENHDIVQVEINRLQNLNYDGDILDKMFKSARYYFRKKNETPKPQKERKMYINCTKDFLKIIDEFIVQNIEYKPSDGFTYFCKTHISDLRMEITHLLRNQMNDSGKILEKVKKTYKNRYFIIQKQF
jgi:hypothetical protein